MSFSLKISATGQYDLATGSFDQAFVSGVAITIQGLTGSFIIQKKQALGNITGQTPTYYNAAGVNGNTGIAFSAGTAITADGLYLVDSTASVVSLLVSAVTGSFIVDVTPVEGAVGGTTGGSGGSGPISVIVQDPTQTYTQPTGDAIARAIHVMASGEVATGASGVALNPVGIGTLDASGNMQPLPMALLDSAPTTATTNGVVTLAYNTMLTGTTATRMMSVSSVGADGVSGSNTLSTGNAVYNGTGWDRLRGSKDAGVLIKPYAFPASDWQYAGVTGGITNTSGVTVKTAAGASVRNYVTAIQYCNTSATATEIVINDGAAGTVLWRGMAPGSMTSTANITFPTPLKGTANTLTEVACVTTASATRVSLQGYTAA